jgi:arsenate reductase-like glutaredoxin family protein
MDIQSKGYENSSITYLASEEDWEGNLPLEEALIANPAIFKTPIVRNGKFATIGYVPDVWKSWE